MKTRSTHTRSEAAGATPAAAIDDARIAMRRLVSTAVETERRRIARELHDGLAQELAYMAAQARRLGRPGEDVAALAERLLAAAEAALEESRAALTALRRPADEPFERSLAAVARSAADRWEVKLELALEPAGEICPEARHALLRVVREAIANAARHGGARTVKVALSATDGLALTIADDGTGVDPAAKRRDCLGLVAMRERVEERGGRFALSTARGAGTRIDIALAA